MIWNRRLCLNQVACTKEFFQTHTFVLILFLSNKSFVICYVWKVCLYLNINFGYFVHSFYVSINYLVVWTHCSGELMSSSGPLLILEGSMDPHWAWGFCSKWFFKDFSPSENKGMISECCLSIRMSAEKVRVRTYTLYDTSGWHVWGWIMYNTPINCSFSLGDSNSGKVCHILKWVTTDSCVWSTGEEHKVWYPLLLPLPSVKLRMLRILLTSW